MKLILSRKGFDSSVGKVASPILPSGRLCSLPIPGPRGNLRYEEIEFASPTDDVTNLGQLVTQLTRGRLTADMWAHLDPDLRPDSMARRAGWRPLFGQTGAAQGHLHSQGVGPGDIFLFYGWFRQTERVEGKLRFVAGASDLHVLFGWLQVYGVSSVDEKTEVPPWAAYHPHLQGEFGRNNTLYCATDSLVLPHYGRVDAGAGVFDSFHPALQLTASQQPRSIWRLPEWCFPQKGHTPLSYHDDAQRWTKTDNGVLLQTVGRGQEFVLDCVAYPQAISWLAGLMQVAAHVEKTGAKRIQRDA